MIYVSLPVHTRPEVVAGQLANFAAFLPEAQVVLHVSANARFSMPELEAALARAGCANAIINPQRVPTNWGGILDAHLANIAWIRRCGRRATRICLHASNDMLVRSGLAGWLGRAGTLMHCRPIRSGSYWRFAAPALADTGLRSLCRRLGHVPVMGSQIEGACYDAALLFEIADLIASEPGAGQAGAYPREEVWLSTLAFGLGVRPVGCPYVYSEVHHFDRVFWSVLRRIDPLLGKPGVPGHLPRRMLEYAFIKSGFHRIRPAQVARIANGAGAGRAEVMSDGNNAWRVCDAAGLFGVKRVPRRVDAPLRTYIDRLAEAAA